MTVNQRLYGADAPLPTYRELRAGPLTVGYEEGAFRYFRWGEHEILRMVYISLRDENWGTLIPIRSNEEWTVEPDRFLVTYDCYYERDRTTLFSWKVTAEGKADGAFSMTIDGLAHQAFLRNRAGFCVLHPIQGTSGQPCELLHPDGAWESTQFPDTISPENPFKQLVGMRWQQASGAWFRLDMTGDIFETEDQRNWTDASFKTFCTPSALPIPVGLQPGDRIRQRIQFRPESPLPDLPSPSLNEVTVLVFEQERTSLPAIGVGASTESLTLTQAAVQELQQASFAHYRVEVVPAQPNWEANFLTDAANAQAIGVPLLVALHLSTNYKAEVVEFLAVSQQRALVVTELLLLSTDGPTPHADLLRTALPSLREGLPDTQIGAGTNYNFTELNRNRLPTDDLDFISYAIHPQVHAFDHRSIIETLATQADTVRTTKTFAGTAPIHVSPVTLRQRVNPYAHNPADRDQTNAQKADSRQPSLWAAGWTLGSLKYLAEAGVEAVTYYQTAGQQGVVSAQGEPYPIALALADALRFRGGQVIRTLTSLPLTCSTLLLVADNRRCWFIANHTDQPIVVQLPESVQEGYRITPVPAQRQPLELADKSHFEMEPFAVWVLHCYRLSIQKIDLTVCISN